MEQCTENIGITRICASPREWEDGMDHSRQLHSVLIIWYLNDPYHHAEEYVILYNILYT